LPWQGARPLPVALPPSALPHSSVPPTSTSEPSTADRLWARLAAGDEAARDQLLVENLGLVHHIARQISRTLAVQVDFDELVSAGTMGLIDALATFDAVRGRAFSTFATPRIRGAILDELRRLDHVPRSVRRKARAMSAACETLTHALGRAPEEREVAEQLGLDLGTLWRWREDVEAAHPVAIDMPAAGAGDGPRFALGDVLGDDTGAAADDVVSHEQEVALLRDALLRLKEQERVVLSLYYYEELKLGEIGAVLELTESRVSQIRSKALGRLRGELRPLRARAA
jgi:RNA polymerase sigma factor FliA